MKRRLRTLGLATMLAGILASPASAAFVSLPSNGAQVNDDAANSIDPKEDAGLVDVAGGTVVAGNVQVPWATFEQRLGDSQRRIGRERGRVLAERRQFCRRREPARRRRHSDSRSADRSMGGVGRGHR